MLHLNQRESNSMMEASNNNINNERESIINITKEFHGLLSKIELEYNQVKSELIQVKKEIKEMKDNEVFKNQNNKKKVSFLKLMKSQSTKIDLIFFIFAIIGSLIAGCAMPFTSLLLGDVIDGFDGSIPKEKVPSIIHKSIINFLIAGILIFIGSLIMVIFWNIIGKRLSNQIKIDYFRTIMKQDQIYFDETNTFELSTKIQNQTKIIESGIGTKVGITLSTIAQFIASFIIGFFTSWKLSLVVTAMLPFLGIGGFFMANAMKQGTEEMRTYEKAGGMAEEILYNIKTVASFANFSEEKNRYNKFLIQSRNAGINQGYKTGFGIGFIIFVIYSSYALAIWYGSILVYKNGNNEKKNFKAGNVITVIFAIIFGCFSLGQAAPNIKAIYEACNAAQDYFELKDRKINLSYGKEKPEKKNLIGHLIINNLNFKYTKSDKWVLNKLNIDFEPNKKLALVGPSGIGKSTIFSLIERFYEPNSGFITFDGKNIKNFDVNYWRNLIGYVQQEPVLFNTTIKENILFGRENITEEQIYEACERAYATEIIKKCGLDYIVGVKGEKLSGGQKQRIAIARAVLLKPKLLLLDEATSALDNKSEFEVQKALDSVSKGITTIIIAHKIDTIKNSDKIFCFDKNGRIAEQGTHDVLLEKNGVYAELYKKRVKQEQERKYIIIGNKEKVTIDNFISNNNNERKSLSGGNNNGSRNNTNNNLNEQSKNMIMSYNQDDISGLNKSKVSQNRILNMDEMRLEDRNIFQKFQNNQKKIQEIKKRRSSINDSLEMSQNQIDNDYYMEEYENKLRIKDNKEYFKKSRRKAFSYLKDNKKFMIGCTFAAGLSGVIWPLYGILLANSIGALSKKNLNDVKKYGLYSALEFLGLAFYSGISLWMQNYFFYGTGEILTSKYRKDIFEKFLNLHIGYFDIKENSPGALLTRLTSDTTKITGIATSILGQILQTIVTLCIGMIVSFFYQWIICAINIAFMPLIIGSYYLQFSLQKGLVEGNNNIDENAGNILSESVLNSKTIFSYNMQYKIVDIYARIILNIGNDYRENKCKYYKIIINGFFYSLTQFVIFAMYATLFYVGGNLYKKEKATFTNILRAIFTILFSALGIGIAQLFVGDYTAAKESIVNLQTILDTNSEIDVSDSEKIGFKKEHFEGKIEFKNVKFKYFGTKNLVFRNLNFTINPGENIAFVGPSGSGKSTIISLIERFYDVTEGEILIDNINIKEYDLVNLRKNIGIVLQQPVLFNRTIKENILYGNLNASEEEIENAAKEANIYYKLMENDNQEINVSGGEKQRIAIARAILKNPTILLLDEATSALDKENEDIIKKTLNKLMKNKTCLIIAHRLSTIINCDKIFFLLNGEIVEEGTHEELMKLNGKYAELYKGSSS